MNTLETTELETLAVQSDNILHLPLGLLGFEKIKRYVLLDSLLTLPERLAAAEQAQVAA